MTEQERKELLSLWAGLVSVVSIYFLTGDYWKAAFIGVFVGASAVLGYGTQWILRGSFAIAVLAIAVALGLRRHRPTLKIASKERSSSGIDREKSPVRDQENNRSVR
jgi:hypothetical protein